MITLRHPDQLELQHRIYFTPLNLDDLEIAREKLGASNFTRKITPRDQELIAPASSTPLSLNWPCHAPFKSAMKTPSSPCAT